MGAAHAPNEHEHEFVADCRVRDAAELLVHRWDATVIMALREGDRRRRDLRDRIGGISDKALTDSLARLLAAAVVHRTRHAEAPPRVEYGLTDRGLSFADGPLAALASWAIEHPAAIEPGAPHGA